MANRNTLFVKDPFWITPGQAKLNLEEGRKQDSILRILRAFERNQEWAFNWLRPEVTQLPATRPSTAKTLHHIPCEMHWSRRMGAANRKSIASELYSKIMPDVQTSTLTPRKAAQQLRSQKKVEKILSITLTLLTEGPADRVTTNAIAARAQISIGSLYQFFPNKEAIFYELFKRWLGQTLQALDDAGEALQHGQQSREDCIDTILEALAGHSDINSRGHWQLRRAMGSSRELAELEAQHLQQILQRIARLHANFSGETPPELRHELALLQNQITIACLQVLAITDESPNHQRVRGWCKKVLMLAFDFPRIDGP